jgi:hypothetical protein
MYKSTGQNYYRHRCVFRYCGVLSSSFQLLQIFFLAFHLQKKHEERQRLLHYLADTNIALATDTLIRVTDME